ncbi:MAG: hypothetical protein ABFD07_19140 [Methanobacterium sp.]
MRQFEEEQSKKMSRKIADSIHGNFPDIQFPKSKECSMENRGRRK